MADIKPRKASRVALIMLYEFRVPPSIVSRRAELCVKPVSQSQRSSPDFANECAHSQLEEDPVLWRFLKVLPQVPAREALFDQEEVLTP